MTPPEEDIREYVTELFRLAALEEGKSSYSYAQADKILDRFSTILDGLVMEEKVLHLADLAPIGEVVDVEKFNFIATEFGGYNTAVSELNSKISTIQSSLKGEKDAKTN